MTSPLSRLRRAGLFIAAALTLAPALAQFDSAEITGTVLDPSGRQVPSARVQLRNEATGVVVESLTNAVGIYRFYPVRVGTYTLLVGSPGFRESTREGLVISVNQRLRADFELVLGQTTEKVAVTEQISLLEPETSGRGQLVSNSLVRELPLLNRDLTTLAVLSAGVVQRSTLSGAISVNGNLWNQNNYLLDGVDNNTVANNTRGAASFIQPPVDAIEEFKVQTSSYSAEFGRGAGAVINATLRSGTNQLHGAGWWFFRDSALNAKNALTSAALLPFRQHQFGGTFGGPILKSKLFYFGAYEGLRSDQAVVRLSTVPNPARFIKGTDNRVIGYDFSGRKPLFNPDTKLALPAQVTTANGLDPRALKLLELYPAPNVGNPDGTANYEYNPSHNTRDDRFDIRVDAPLSPRVSLFGRFSFQDSFLTNSGLLPGLAEGGTGTGNSNFDKYSKQVAFGWTTVLSASQLNEFRFGWSQVKDARLPLNPGTASASELTGIPGLPAGPTIDGGLPNMVIGSASTMAPLGRGSFLGQHQMPSVITLKDTFSWLKQSHSIKAGFEFRRPENEFFDIRALLGNFTFNGQRTRNAANASSTGEPLADFLFFAPYTAQLSVPAIFTHSRDFAYLFLQDDWRVTPRLTLNLGLRYERGTPLREQDNRYANFDPALRNGRGGIRLASAGDSADRGLVELSGMNFGPRFGFAYTATQRLILRGGYGLYQNFENRPGVESVLGFNPPFAFDGSFAFSSNPEVKNIDQAVAFLNSARQALPNTEEGLSNAGFKLWSSVLLQVQQRQQSIPYVQQWNLTVQHEPLRNLLVELAYVGNTAHQLATHRNLNHQRVAGRNDSRPFPDFGDMQWLETRGNSSYHSLQLRLERRFQGGFSFLSTYAWSHSITDAPGSLSGRGAAGSPPQNSDDLRGERADSPDDLRHKWVSAWVCNLPFGRSHRLGANWGRALETIAGGWQISGITTLRSGFPLDVTVRSAEAISLGANRTPRPDVNGPARLQDDERSTARWFNTTAFARPSSPFGNCAANCGGLTGPESFNVDFLLGKSVPLNERMQFQLRGEFFNLLNNPKYDSPDTQFGSPTFGRILSSYGERQVQIGLKFLF